MKQIPLKPRSNALKRRKSKVDLKRPRPSLHWLAVWPHPGLKPAGLLEDQILLQTNAYYDLVLWQAAPLVLPKTLHSRHFIDLRMTGKTGSENDGCKTHVHPMAAGTRLSESFWQ